jgi:hypothetical protein
MLVHPSIIHVVQLLQLVVLLVQLHVIDEVFLQSFKWLIAWKQNEL